MKHELCIACDHCEPSDTNARQQVRCAKISSYVDRFNGCDDFENKVLDECFKIIGNSKLTDNDIIKALECCSTYGMSCKHCPAFVKVDRSKCREVLTGAKDLINRQQAEIERLEAENNRFANIGKMYSEIKAEAIKEFAEMVEKLKYPNSHEPKGFVIYGEDFDNLVKERVGDVE